MSPTDLAALRCNPVGVWVTQETLPAGTSVVFRADGTATVTHFSGLGHEDVEYKWRPDGENRLLWKYDHPDPDFDYVATEFLIEETRSSYWVSIALHLPRWALGVFEAEPLLYCGPPKS